MIKMFGLLVTVAVVSGLSLLMEVGSAAWQRFNARKRTRPRPSALPHAKGERDRTEDDTDEEDLFV